MGTLRLGVLVSGRGTNLQAILDSIEDGYLPAEVRIVLSDVAGAPALDRARARGVKAVYVDPAGCRTKREYDSLLAGYLRREGTELVLLAGYMRILTRGFIEEYRGRIMNIHPSLLPSFPGLEAQRQALEHGVKVTGCTVHFVDEGMDTGPIIIQRAVPVLEDDTVESLAQRILKEEHVAYPAAVKLYAEGRLMIEGRRVRIKQGV